jgi:hypothetical protein
MDRKGLVTEMKDLQKASTRFLIPLLVGVGLVSGVYALQQHTDWQSSLVSTSQFVKSDPSNTGLTPQQIQISQTVQSQIPSQEIRQNYNDLNQLYQQAAIGDIELQNIAQEWAKMTGGTVVLPPGGLKGRKRAEEKIRMDYNGDASRITDLTRISLEYDSLEQLYQALQAIPETANLVRFKDRFMQPTPGGYRDILLNLKLSNQHIAEIQLNLKSINQVRFGEGYPLYRKIRQIQVQAMNENRTLTPAEIQEIDALNQASKNLYDAALHSSSHSESNF